MKKVDITKGLPLAKLFYASVVLSILLFVFIFAIESRLPPEVPLFYGLAEGEEQLSSRRGLLIPSTIAISIIIVNLILAKITQSVFIQKTLVAASFCVIILALITTLRITLLVGSF